MGGATTTDLNFSISVDGIFLLMIAAAKGYIDIIELMSNNSTLDVNKTDKNGVNAFWIAAWFGRVETMRKLLSMHVDPQATNQNGSNSLHISVKLGH